MEYEEYSINMQSTKLYLFYTSWCGYCSKFRGHGEKADPNSEWGKTYRYYKMNPQLGVNPVEVLCDENNALAQRYGVTGYPTVILMKSNGKGYIYSGNREFLDIRDFISDKMQRK